MESPLGEHAAADGGSAAGGEPPPAPPAPIGASTALEAALAACLRTLPSAEDPRFAVWRPGSAQPEVGVVPAERVEPPVEPPRRDAPPADPLDGFFYREGEDAGPFTRLAGAPPVEERPSGPVVLEEYLTFVLGGEEYAIAIERVREVLRCPPVTEVPRAPPDVRGVVTVRGEVIAVIDPRRRLEIAASPPEEAAARIVVVDAGDGPCGILVDAISSVVRLEPGSVEPCPQAMGAAADCVAGVGRLRERLFTVLDLGALLRRTAPRRGEGRGRDA